MLALRRIQSRRSLVPLRSAVHCAATDTYDLWRNGSTTLRNLTQSNVCVSLLRCLSCTQFIPHTTSPAHPYLILHSHCVLPLLFASTLEMYRVSSLVLLSLATVLSVLYALPVGANPGSTSAASAPLLSSSSTSIAPPPPTVDISWVTGCGWLAPSGVLYGCNGDSSLPLSRATLSVDSVDRLPADWELAVHESNYSVKGADWCTVVDNTTVNCTLPAIPDSALYGRIVELWLQDSEKRVLSNLSVHMVYSAAPVVRSVDGCGFISYTLAITYGCTLPGPVLTVHGSDFSRAWDGGDKDGSPILLQGAHTLYQCVVSSFTDTTMVCADVLPTLAAEDSGTFLNLTVVTVPGKLVSNMWGVQITNNNKTCSGGGCSGSTGSTVSPPHIDGISGGGCTSWDNVDRTDGCTTNYASLFTISGSGFNAPSDAGSLVQMLGPQTETIYTCSFSQMTESTIICNDVVPSLDSQDSGSVFRVTVETVQAKSNAWNVQITDDGPYNPTSSADSSAFIAGMDLVTFIIVVSVVGVVVVLTLSLAVLSCCCGVGLASIARCCFSQPSPSYTSIAVPSASAALLVAPQDYVVDASSAYPSIPSHLAFSRPLNPAHYPIV